MFKKLVSLNCWSNSKALKRLAGHLLEKLYCCEINCMEIDRTTLFAHHARGCTIIASKICENVVIMQNVTVGSNLKYNRVSGVWENVGNPIISKGVVIADGAKVLGPVIIGEHSVVAAGAVITKDIPANSVAYGVNQFRPKDADYDLLFAPMMISREKIMAANHELIARFDGKK